MPFWKAGRTGPEEIGGQPSFGAAEDALSFELCEMPVAVGRVEERLEARDRGSAVLDDHGLPAANAIQQCTEAVLGFGYAGALHLAIIANIQ